MVDIPDDSRPFDRSAPTAIAVTLPDGARREFPVPVTGADIFDLQLIATMQANGIDRICTFNTDDFAAFPELAVVLP